MVRTKHFEPYFSYYSSLTDAFPPLIKRILMNSEYGFKVCLGESWREWLEIWVSKLNLKKKEMKKKR